VNGVIKTEITPHFHSIYFNDQDRICISYLVSLLCTGVYIEVLIKAAAASWTSSSSSSALMDSFLPCGVLLDESCDGEEKRNFKKECEAADALVQISGMLVDAAEILRDCHKVTRRQIQGRRSLWDRGDMSPQYL